ncbi:MAG TPA: hypothetical protein VEC93_19275, partial [Anaerolineae bacterium]|nr:hypothetical protein [Anaerolineae bacterium]
MLVLPAMRSNDVTIAQTMETGLFPGIALEKFTNDEEADTPPGPMVPVGEPVTWAYLVTNTGQITLTNIVVTDSDLNVTVSCPKNELIPEEHMTCTASGTAAAGQHSNTGHVEAEDVSQSQTLVSADDDSHYFGVDSGITLQKSTNGQDANAAPGPSILVGGSVNWTYLVHNTGNVTLSNIQVSDDQGVSVSCPKTSLSPDESMICTASGTATPGQYANTGTVTATPPLGPAVTASDDSHYFGAVPGITLQKSTNGQDANAAP